MLVWIMMWFVVSLEICLLVLYVFVFRVSLIDMVVLEFVWCDRVCDLVVVLVSVWIVFVYE